MTGLRDKLIADAEILARVAIVAGIGGLTIPQDVFNVGADVAALTAAVGIAGRAVLHKLGEMLSKA